MMDYKEIIQRDVLRNYPDRKIDASSAIENFEKYREMGGAYFSTEKTIIVLKCIGDSTVEFHAMNGGNGLDLTQAVNSMLEKLSVNYEKVVTYYDNPRISELSKYGLYAITVKKIDEGMDRTYEMTIDLTKKV